MKQLQFTSDGMTPDKITIAQYDNLVNPQMNMDEVEPYRTYMTIGRYDCFAIINCVMINCSHCTNVD